MAFTVDRNRKFFKRILSTPAEFKVSSKLFGSQDCFDDKNYLDFSSIFFKICGFRSSILLSLQVFISREAVQIKFDSSEIFRTNHNSLLRIATNEIALFCIDNRAFSLRFVDFAVQFCFISREAVQVKLTVA